MYENATPEMLRDFFWDDEFRLKWDDMILHAQTVEECPTTGTMIVHWIRKVSRLISGHLSEHDLSSATPTNIFITMCSFLFSAAIENTLLDVEYGNQEDHITA